MAVRLYLRQSGTGLRTLDGQISADKALGHVDLLDLDLDIVDLAIGLLGAFKDAATAQEG